MFNEELGEAIRELQEYVENISKLFEVPIDLRFRCLGDINFEEFSIECDQYRIRNIEQMKMLVTTYLIGLLKYAYPNQKIAIYVERITEAEGDYLGYDVYMGGVAYHSII